MKKGARGVAGAPENLRRDNQQKIYCVNSPPKASPKNFLSVSRFLPEWSASACARRNGPPVTLPHLQFLEGAGDE